MSEKPAEIEHGAVAGAAVVGDLRGPPMRLPECMSGEGAPVGMSRTTDAGARGRGGAAYIGAVFDEDASTKK